MMREGSTECHIWHINLTAADIDISILSATEQARGHHYQNFAKQRQFFAARAALRIILANYLHCAPQEIIFNEGEHGKPHVAGLEFNLSHSHDCALLAVAPSPVGIDIQKMLTDIAPLKIAARFFHPWETKFLQQLPVAQQLTAFYRLWTAKEALIKAAGLSMAAFPQFAVAGKTLMLETSVDAALAAWRLQTLDVDAGYAAAIAVPRNLTKMLRQVYVAG